MIRIKDGEFVDEYDRILNLRGVNVAGSSKIPHNGNSISGSSGRDVTFVGRPFPLSEAALHFTRLRACGFTFIRFIVTWEAIEHAGPGIYDTAYLDYIRQVLEKASQFGIRVFIDPHQDVWSRWTGGDGAPLWTLELVGFDVDNFPQCGAALCQQTYGQGYSSREQELMSRETGAAAFPKMIWPTNYFKLACATMFTLFWAGKRFAPQFTVDVNDDDDDSKSDEKGQKKINIQTFLQTHYINAMSELMKRLTGLDNIVGIGTMNEPSSGYINVADLSRGFVQSPGPADDADNESSVELKYGLSPTPFQGMCLGEGHSQRVGEWSNGMMQYILGKPDRWVTVDPKGRKAWKYHVQDKHVGNTSGCVWRQAGVWRINPQTLQPELLQPNYFANVDFGIECYVQFAADFANAMRAVWRESSDLSSSSQSLLIFVELPPLEFSSTPFPQISSSPSYGGLSGVVNATHWYDGVTLFTKSWRSYVSINTRTLRPIVGYKSIFKSHVRQLAAIKRLGDERMENSPTLIGECGIPFDMHGGKSYRGSNSKCRNENGAQDSFGPQLAAMDHTIRCLEANLLSFTLWCYTPDNTNIEGDLWNGEDLSIFSADQRCGLNKNDAYFIYDGLRAARAVVRPYARCMAAQPLENAFDMQKGLFRYRGIGSDGDEKRLDMPTEIFVPKLWCLVESDMKIGISEGCFEVEEHEHWFTVKYWHVQSDSEHSLEIRFS